MLYLCFLSRRLASCTKLCSLALSMNFSWLSACRRVWDRARVQACNLFALIRIITPAW